jgi:hypothetical protein
VERSGWTGADESGKIDFIEGDGAMIIFDLVCSRGHKFECWFRSHKAFEEQRAFRVIHCPVCNDNQVEKAISTFGIKKHSDPQQKLEPEMPAESSVPKNDPHQVLKAITEYVNKNFEDVGLNFAKEALKIHWGEAEKRNIKGTTLPQEEKVLEEEGVPFLKLPVLKRLDN